jgi:hypothetical protein
MYMQYIQGLCQSRHSTTDHALFLVASATMAVWSLERPYAWLPPKPLIFPAPGFALCNVANIHIFMILYDLCLLSAQFCYIIIYVRKFESHVQIANRCAGQDFLPLLALCSRSCVVWTLPLLPNRCKHPQRRQDLVAPELQHADLLLNLGALIRALKKKSLVTS